MTLVPCGHRLVVKPFKQKDVDDVLKKHAEFYAKLEVVNSNKVREDQSVDRGVVLAIGPTAWKTDSLGGKPWCKVGDTIVFAKFSGKFVDDVVILNDDDCIAVVGDTN